MNKEFEEALSGIARSFNERRTKVQVSGAREPDSPSSDALDHFFKTASEAVSLINEKSGSDVVSINRMPGDFMEAFLDITGSGGGFSLLSAGQYVIAFDDSPDTLVFIGKQRTGRTEKKNYTQLLKLTVSRSDKGIVIRDNTGRGITARDVVLILFRWLMSI